MANTIYTDNIEANISDAYVLTGTKVAVPDLETALAQASALIESVTGVILNATDRMTPVYTKDAVWVRKAIVFQAAWMVEQADVLSRMSALRVSQDGQEIIAEDALTFVLAPLAKRALGNCSWSKNGTYRVAPATTSMSDVRLMAADNHPWVPMGGM